MSTIGSKPSNANEESEAGLESERSNHLDSLSASIVRFSEELLTLRTAYRNMQNWFGTAEAASVLKVNEFLDSEVTRSAAEVEPNFTFLHSSQYGGFQGLERNLAQVRAAYPLVLQGLFITMISRKEALIGDIVKYLEHFRQDIFLGERDQVISLNDLEAFESIAAYRQSLLDVGVDKVSRLSFYEFVKLIRKELSIDVDFGCCWGRFIEAAERRNCHAHNDGKVSAQYLANTSAAGYMHDLPLAIGDALPLTNYYFNQATLATLEVGVKLGLHVWRAISDTIGNAEYQGSIAEVIHELVVQAIESRDFSLARKIAEFAYEKLITEVSDVHKRILVINIAQTYKGEGSLDAMERALSRLDWTATSGTVLFAIDVLRDDFTAAEARMPRCCSDEDEGLIGSMELLSWPLFTKFRDTDEFHEGFKAAFGYSPHVDAPETLSHFEETQLEDSMEGDSEISSTSLDSN